MKSLFLALALGFSSTLAFAADTANPISYKATVTGVVCSSCKMHITAALKKLPSVDHIEFSRGEKEGTQNISFSSTAPGLTKEDAVKALGDESSRYEILSLDKAKG